MNIIKYIFNRQYRLFMKKIRQTQVSIWELEFKIAKARQVREGVRQDRDRAVEALNQIEVMLKAHQEGEGKMTPEILAETEKQKEGMIENIRRYERQMEMIDQQLYHGFPGNPEIGMPPEPAVIEKIKAATELQEMYRDYAKQL